MIKNFTFFENYKEVIEQIKIYEEKVKFLFAIYEFMYFDIEPNFEENSLLKIGWLGIKSSLETSKNRGSHNIKTNEKQNKNKTKTNKKQTSSISTSISINKDSNRGVGKEKEKKDTKETILKRFEEFWDKYPRKKNKSKAKEWYVKNKPNEELHKEIKMSILFCKDDEQWKKDDGQYIPYPSTFLNQKRWEDFRK